MIGLVYTDTEKGYTTERLRGFMSRIKRIIGGTKTFEEARAKLRQKKGLPVDSDISEVMSRVVIRSTFYNQRLLPFYAPEHIHSLN